MSADNGPLYLSYTYDDLERVTDSRLDTPLLSPASEVKYGYDAGNQRTQQVFTAGNYVNYTYDNIGQLKTAKGYESGGAARLQEQLGYGYDAAWNLNQRTNNALVQTFSVNSLNELSSATRSGTFTVAGQTTEPGSSLDHVTVSGTGLTSSNAVVYADGSWARTNATLANGVNTYTATAVDTSSRTATDSVSVNLPGTNTFVYDLNGNLRTNNTRILEYDDENQLIRITEPSAWKEEFVYDGLLRRRITRAYTWQSSSWLQTNEVRYVYDEMLVVQERDGNNVPQVTYTRGSDLSGGLQGAGGIGGLLARTENAKLLVSDPNAQAYYFHDANGNVMCLVNTNGAVVAQYQYDPYGNMIGMSGPLAAANVYRFSDKEWDAAAGLYYYGYRFYSPSLQRWLNCDPLTTGSSVLLNSISYPSSLAEDPNGETSGDGMSAWITLNVNLSSFSINNPAGAIDPFGLEITCMGDDNFKKEVKKTINDLKSQPNGAILIDQLEKSKNRIYIVPVPTGPGFPKGNFTVPRDQTNATNGKGAGSTVAFDPSSWTGGTDDSGSNHRPPYIGLGHELGHARDFDMGGGNFNYNPAIPNSTPPAEEKNIKRENLLRNEHKLTPRSCYYR